jgi:hypothetical protein
MAVELREYSAVSAIDLTPLIDVVFQLLIFSGSERHCRSGAEVEARIAERKRSVTGDVPAERVGGQYRPRGEVFH